MLNKIITIIIALLFLQYDGIAQDGLLDASFDTDGVVTMDISNSNDVMKSIITQADGKNYCCRLFLKFGD